MRLPNPVVSLERATELDQTCLSILTKLGHRHVFQGLLEMLPAERQRVLVALRPPPSATLLQATQAYQRQWDVLKSWPDDVFSSGQSCCLHEHSSVSAQGQLRENVTCPAFWRDPSDLHHSLRPLRVNFSGPSCVAWSHLGLQRGWADMSTEPFNIWVRGLLASEYDIVFVEQAASFPWMDFEAKMGAGWEMLRVVFSPLELALRRCSSLASMGVCVFCHY